MLLLLVVVSIFSTGLSMPGGWSEVTSDSSKTDLLALLTESEGKLYTLGMDYNVTKIETQVVAGRNIKYTIQMKDSTCSLTIFDQPWTHTRQVMSDSCSSLRKRQLAGGYSPVTDASLRLEYQNLLTTLLPSNYLSSNSFQIVHMETQVVAGINIRYTIQTAGHTCTMTVFNQVWTKTLELTSNTCTPKSVRQLGGVRAGSYSLVTDAKLIEEYKSKLTSLAGTNSQMTIHKIETQVVSGINIKYTVTMPGVHGTCEIVVYSQSWTHTLEISHNTCQTSTKRQLLGGYNNADIHKPMVQKCLSMSLDKLNQMSNSMFRMVETNIMSAKQQVVAGMNYAITFQTSQSTCMNSQDQMGKMALDCPVDANSMMAPSTWTAHCYHGLGGADLTFTSVDMATDADLQLDNDLNLELKPVESVKIKVAAVKSGMFGKSKDKFLKGKPMMKVDQAPSVNLLRKKRDMNFLIEKLDKLKSFGKEEDLDNLVETGKALLGGGDNHDLVNHVKDLIGQDGHDMIKHAGEILGGGDHDYVSHAKKIFGGDGHDFIAHGKKLIGGDDHDLKPHGKTMIGGDDHDLKPHGNTMIGGDDHDLKPHGKTMIGGDDHDLIPHGKTMIGGDDHDLIPHGKTMIGGDDHDLKPHGKTMIGGDDHDLIPHGKTMIGGDDHDLIPHGKKLIGGGDHDLMPHGKKLIGGDDHDLKPHGKTMIGGDDHDLIPHGKKLIGGDDHDLKFHGSKSKIGGDDHDYCHIGMFNEFKAKYNKLYGSPKEEEKRFGQFCVNMRMARKIQETEKGTAIYGATKFADLTREEFQQYVGKRWDTTANEGMKKADIPKGQAPDSFDWRDHGAVTPVKNQGSCGSCWAFSTTGNIEGQWAIKKKNLISLSEQELVDCDKVDEGCNGGLPSQAYKEIERLGGLETEAEYSYKGEDEKCIFKKSDVKVYINDSVSISSDEAEMASWLSANGPISIGINAFAMQFYMGGISHPWKIFCNPKNLDHGVLIVGYGVQDSKPYWIVKNSWGPDWGEKGYYLVYRGDGVCGLNTMCTSAVVD